MKYLGRLLLLVAFVGGRSVVAGAQGVHLETVSSVAEGVHLWYEIKADPEEANNLIICGTKWDALTNGPYGFVYTSSDSGSTWRSVLEDRNSPWVTEHSCAFGPQHRAYFISEASRVFDGEQHHDLGVTRLFVSADAGQHWTEKNKTGWADHSASVVSPKTSRLYTFFNDPSARDPGKSRGNSVGLLVFSPDGEHVAGSFLAAGMRDRDYQDVYPSNAVALKDGDVSSLYYGVRQTEAGREGELGFVRAHVSPEPVLEQTIIARGILSKDCWNAEVYAQAYDPIRNRLFVLYVEGCGTTRMMLTSSVDDGRSWTRGAVIAEQKEGTMVLNPSLAVNSDGVLELLWSEWNGKTGRWLFAQIQDKRFIEPPIELPPGTETFEAGNDSLWTTIRRPRAIESNGANASLSPPITIGVRGLVDVVWRSSGLIALGGKTLAIWPSRGDEGMRLKSGVLGPVGSASTSTMSAVMEQTANPDVTRNSLITYGGTQSFDKATGKLTVCLSLSNRGNESISLPIHLETTDVRSPAGEVSVLNATNGLPGAGAVWDISGSITGDRLAPGTTTNPFCLSVRVRGFSERVSPLDENLLMLKVRVIGSSTSSWEPRTKP